MRFQLHTVSTAAILGSLVLGPVALAQEEEEEAHADVLLFQTAAGEARTGVVDFEAGVIENLDGRVFEGEFGEIQTGFATDPGFNALSNPALYPEGFAPLPGNAAVSFNLTSFDAGNGAGNLQYWNGFGTPDFAPVTAETLTVGLGIASAVANGGDQDVAGFTFDQTSVTGSLHRHLNFTLGPEASLQDGFYAWGMELEVAGLEAAEPIFLIFGNGAHTETQHEAAAEFFEANVVPEPASAALLGAGVLLLTRRRR